jgi:hypothetical protein
MPDGLSETGTIQRAICQKPVELETAQTDERGWAVHEDCYMETLQQRRRLRVPGPWREQIASPSS